MAVDEDRARWEKNLIFSTEIVDGEDGYRLDFTIMCNSKRFVVTVCSTKAAVKIMENTGGYGVLSL